MKNLIIGLVLGSVLGALVLNGTVKAQTAVFVGRAGAECGSIQEMRSANVPTSIRDRNMENLGWWEQGFVDGALAANHQQSRESMAMVEARFASFCAGTARREYTMRDVGMEIVKDMKTAVWP